MQVIHLRSAHIKPLSHAFSVVTSKLNQKQFCSPRYFVRGGASIVGWNWVIAAFGALRNYWPHPCLGLFLLVSLKQMPNLNLCICRWEPNALWMGKKKARRTTDLWHVIHAHRKIRLKNRERGNKRDVDRRKERPTRQCAKYCILWRRRKKHPRQPVHMYIPTAWPKNRAEEEKSRLLSVVWCQLLCKLNQRSSVLYVCRCEVMCLSLSDTILWLQQAWTIYASY